VNSISSISLVTIRSLHPPNGQIGHTALAAISLLILTSSVFCFAQSYGNNSLINDEPVQLKEDLTAVQVPVIDAYRYLHEHPELGGKEVLAQKYIADRLKSAGYTEFIKSPSAPTSVIAVLRSGSPGPTIALRAELDGRKTQEPSQHNPCSMIPGLMHSCGHDAHAAILMGVAEVLIRQKAHLNGTVVFLFQPAEETAGGADDIVRDSILQKMEVKAIYALHVAPKMPVGTISIAPGCIMAGSNYFTLTIRGKGSHAAVPSSGNDVLTAATSIASNLAQLPARRLSVTSRPCVISLTYFKAGDSSVSNILPDSAVMQGTIRSFEPLENPELEESEISISGLIDTYLTGAASAYSVSYSFNLRKGAPPLKNDSLLRAEVIRSLPQNWNGVIQTNSNRTMFSEDFAFYTDVVPSLYISLGIEREDRGSVDVHMKDFTIHPDALEVGTRLMTLIALNKTNSIR